jgi:predicted flap endonuclease-1-like 5' DNA nuclease
MSYPVTEISHIGPEAVQKLRAAGIRTTSRLLDSAKTPKDRKQLAERTGIDGKRILSWANLADRMRIKGVGEDYAGLLQAAGVDTVKELKYRNPAKLAHAMAEANAKRKLVRILPSPQLVERWIDQAKRLQLKITYR